MGIGLEPNDRRFGYWQDTEDQAIHTLQTSDLVKMFGVPMGMHLVVEHMIVTVENGENVVVTFDSKYRRTNLAGTAEITGSVGINGPMMPVGRQFIVNGVTGSLQQQVKVLNIPVYDEIRFNKGADANDMLYEFYYHFEMGAMMWLDEWAALLRDKSNAPFQHGVGRVYRQVGDYYQINKRNIIE